MSCLSTSVLQHGLLRSASTCRRLSSLKVPLQQHYDVVIVGGGVVGLTLAQLLRQQCPRYSIALMERGKGPSAVPSPQSPSVIPNPRSYALSLKSLALLEQCDALEGVPMGRYDSMQVWESNSPAMLVFSHLDLPFNEESPNEMLGACVEDSAIVSSLWNKLQSSSSVSLFTERSLQGFKETSTDVKLQFDNEGDTLTTNLLIAADGATSPIRTKLGIPWRGLEYGRTAITFTVQLEKGQNRRAFQRFLPNGPIALLPTHSSTHAVIVWSTTPAHAEKLKSFKEEELVHELNGVLQRGPERLPQALFHSSSSGNTVFNNLMYGVDRVLDTMHYGMGMRHWSDDEVLFLAPPRIEEVVSPRFTFPLSCKVASEFCSSKIALVGDAAHTVHPLAGQGLNLGLDDVSELTQVVSKAHDAGMDVAQFLSDYQNNRQRTVPLHVGGIHLLHSLFGTQNPLLKHGKSLGMSFVNQVGPVRQQLVKVATGL